MGNAPPPGRLPAGHAGGCRARAGGLLRTPGDAGAAAHGDHLANVVDAGTFVQFPAGRGPVPAPPVARGRGVESGAGRGGQGRGGQPSPFADLPAFCRVAASIKPSSDSDIKIELWMPAAGWNGKFVVPGNGGFAGAIAPAGLATNLRNGYAAATTDTGHEGGSGAFMIDHPERLTDFADRAIHETTAKGKAIVAAFYGNGPKLLVLQRLLDRRPPGPDGRPAFSRRLRRHRRRRAGDLRVAAVGRTDLDLERDAQGRCELPDAGQATRCCTMRSSRSATRSTA